MDRMHPTKEEILSAEHEAQLSNLRAQLVRLRDENADLRALLAELLEDWCHGENPDGLTDRCRRALAGEKGGA